MEENFDYQLVPDNFTHCFVSQCPKGETCLHRLAAVHCTDLHPSIWVVNPHCIPEDKDTCPFYKSSRKIRVAWGIEHLLDKVPHQDAPRLKNLMLSHFSRNLYYRFYRKERYLAPEQQEYIRQIFRQHGITEEPAFDFYTEEYKWD